MVFLMILAAIAVFATLTVNGHVIDENHYDHSGLRVSRNDQSLPLFLNHSLSSAGKSNRSRGEHVRCSTNDPTIEEMQASATVVQKWMANTEFRESRQGSIITVPTYFHIIYTGTIGVITDEEIQKQLAVLNDSFSPYGFLFTLLGTTRTESFDWYYALDDSVESYDMFTTLRVGDATTLNLYLNDAGGLLGYATFPSWYELDPQADGVVVKSGTIPGGDIEFFNEGKTAVHEVGHWLGLYHTFQPDIEKRFSWAIFFASYLFSDIPGCYYNDDGINDTPKQASPTSGCPTARNSCPLNIGLDPIHNYMDYSDDVCYTEFTTSQMDRMQAMWYEYRAVQ